MRRTVSILIASVLPIALARPAHAGGNVCFYGDKKFDDRYAPPTDFTGEHSCKDIDSGHVVLREHLVRGVRNGPYIKYEARSGQIEESGSYRNDERDGLFRSYRDGAVVGEYTYADGKRRGLQKSLSSGVVTRIYVAGDNERPDGELRFNKDGQLSAITCGTRPIGKQDNAWCGFDGKQSTVVLFDEQGRKRAERQFLGGREQGVSRTFNVTTGAVMSERRYENGKALKDGEQHFDRSGTLVSKKVCDPKQPNVCTETSYFPSSQQASFVATHAGTRLTQSTEYYQNGRPKEEIVTDGDHVRIRDYYDDGKVTTNGAYVEVPDEWSPYAPDGVVEEFDRSGMLRARERYVRGQRQGSTEFWDVREGITLHTDAQYDRGNLVRVKHFANDVLVDESEYFPDGSTKSHKDYSASKNPSAI
jgi:antitoxin component YwqK of YwqJK toxin-antitoxin module